MHTARLLAGLFALASIAFSVAPSGKLTFTAAPGGGVNISAGGLDWLLPVGPPNGAIVTGAGTQVSFSAGAGTIGPGVTASIADISFAAGSQQFVTFSGISVFSFSLISAGPGSANTNCAGLVAGQSCSPAVGSPLVLTATGSGVAISIAMYGAAGDSFGVSTWIGVVTAQVGALPNVPRATPADVQSFLGSGGVITTAYSAEFALGASSSAGGMQTVSVSGYSLTYPISAPAGGTMAISWTAPAGHAANDFIGLYSDTAGYWFQSVGSGTSGSFTVPVPSAPGQYFFRYVLGNVWTVQLQSSYIPVH